jgi:hypothetical protein
MAPDIAAINVLRIEERPGAASAWSYPSSRSLVEHVVHEGQSLVIVLRAGFAAQGIHFFTPNSFSQQLGYMQRDTGYSIPPHTHNPVPRTVSWTQETLFIKSGLVRLDVYSPQRRYLESLVLTPGDVVLMAAGGHGLVMLEPSEIIEVKQGPYVGEADKSHFERVRDDEVVYHVEEPGDGDGA